MGELKVTVPEVIQSPDCFKTIDGYRHEATSTIAASKVSQIIRLDPNSSSISIHTDDFALLRNNINLEVFAQSDSYLPSTTQ